jgi:DNA polymerase-1
MNPAKPKPIILIDGSSYLHRAYHALPALTNSKGEPTGAIFGVINMIRRLLKDYDPEYIAVVFDPKGKTTRHQIYPEYKAHRPPMHDELRVQIQPLHAMIKAMGLPLVMIDGVEADDVIGTLAKEAEKHSIPVLISTGDKDLAQLVDANITLINTMNNQILDINGVKEKFGVLPEQIIDYLTLMGDTSDNIPGVPKVGPKTAVKWLEEYNSLDNIVANAEKISGKVGENLRDNLKQLELSRRLVTIFTDIPMPLHFNELKRQPIDAKALTGWFNRFEFKSWLDESLDPQQQAAANNEQLDYQTILTADDWKKLWQQLQQVDVIAFDTETTSLDALNADLVFIYF